MGHLKQKSSEVGQHKSSEQFKSRDPFVGTLWDDLRQGARNVAGIRYQLAVTAHLLVESRHGALRFVEVIPEGYEDIDCRDRDSVRWFVQVKEVGAGAGIVTAASVADAISHAAPVAPPPSRIVVVTDGRLGGQVAETGWAASISQTAGFDIDSTISALARRGHARAEAEDLVDRSHVVRLPWNLTPVTTNTLADTYSINPTAAGVVVSKLFEDLVGVAADQRTTTADHPGSRDLNDLDALVENTMASIDVSGLESAVRLGICETADYASGPAGDLNDFLGGIDAIPQHIGAGYDVIRPGPARDVQAGLEQSRYVLLAGPSGSGKSTQMWRSAYDFSVGARVVRVLRLESESEVDELVRYVRLLNPESVGPVVVCCDDLGRPGTAKWPHAARRLLEQPGVRLLGAARNEDFTADLLCYGGELVNLSLDEAIATAIADQLAYAGVPLALEVPEAVESADGQLMEYMALLTSGKRMRAVLASQVRSLLCGDDPMMAETARLICAAHVLGVSLEASAIGELVKTERHSLSRALQSLQNEHIVTSQDRISWRGLHQRRSDVLTELLHETPPPSLAETLEAVLRAVRPTALGWCLRRIVELFPDLQVDHTPAIELAVSACSSAEEMAILMESLERADNSVTAKAYTPILKRYKRRSVKLDAWVMHVCADKLAGIRLPTTVEDSIFNRLVRRISACAEELPDRCTTYCDTAIEACGDRLVGLLTASSLQDAVRLLEAVAPYTDLSGSDLQEIAEKFAWPDGILDNTVGSLHGRLRNAAYLAAEDCNQFARAWGSVAQRLNQAAQSNANTLSALIANSDSASAADDDPTSVTLYLLVNFEDGQDDSPRFPWDIQRQQDQHDEILNRSAVDLAEFVGECCPEFEAVEVITVLADGEQVSLGDLAPGYKRLAEDIWPDRCTVRIGVGMSAAIARQTAACSWTQLVRNRELAAVLVAQLVEDAPRRLSRNDNERRRTDWLRQLREVEDLLVKVPHPPTAPVLDIKRAAVSWDNDRDEDDLSVSLYGIVLALHELVPQDPETFLPAWTCHKVSEAAQKLAVAISEASLLTTRDEHKTYTNLYKGLNRLSGLLSAIALDPTTVSQIKGSHDEFSDNINRLIAASEAKQTKKEYTNLENTFQGISGTEIIQVLDDDTSTAAITKHQWLITVPPEGWEKATSLIDERLLNVVEATVSVVCAIGHTLLPIAVRPSRITPSGFIPLDLESIEHLASAVGRDIISGAALNRVRAVARELELASWYNARRKMRTSGWPTPDGDAHAHALKAKRLIDSAPPEEHDLHVIMSELVSRVFSELEGHTDTNLSAEFATAIFPDPEIEHGQALDKLAQAVFAAIDIELDRAVSAYDGNQ